MTPEESRLPVTRGDVRRIEEKLDKVLVGLHGDGTKDNVGLFHRVDDIEDFFASIKRHVGALWTGGLTVASFVVGNKVLDWLNKGGGQ